VDKRIGAEKVESEMAKARLLLLGLDPDIVDYSKSPVPGLTAAKVRSAIEADRAKLEERGYNVTILYVDEGKTAEAQLANTLATGRYDCIMIGAGLRIVPPYFLLFEKQRHPSARAGFDEAMLQYRPDGHRRSRAALGLSRIRLMSAFGTKRT
jgi:hypothetical protein